MCIGLDSFLWLCGLLPGFICGNYAVGGPCLFSKALTYPHPYTVFQALAFFVSVGRDLVGMEAYKT